MVGGGGLIGGMEGGTRAGDEGARCWVKCNGDGKWYTGNGQGAGGGGGG